MALVLMSPFPFLILLDSSHFFLIQLRIYQLCLKKKNLLISSVFLLFQNSIYFCCNLYPTYFCCNLYQFLLILDLVCSYTDLLRCKFRLFEIFHFNVGIYFYKLPFYSCFNCIHKFCYVFIFLGLKIDICKFFLTISSWTQKECVQFPCIC